MNESISEKLAIADAARQRLDAIEQDKTLVQEGEAIRAEIQRQEEIARLQMQYADQKSKAQAMLADAKPAVVAFRKKFEAAVAALVECQKESPSVVTPITKAGDACIVATKTLQRIRQLEGRKTDSRAELEELWRTIGGEDPALNSMPPMSSLPREIQEMFRFGIRYWSSAGVRNFVSDR